jgi:hypothetical protein
MRRTLRKGLAHALGGRTSLLVQRQPLDRCALATRVVEHDKGNQHRHKY